MPLGSLTDWRAAIGKYDAVLFRKSVIKIEPIFSHIPRTLRLLCFCAAFVTVSIIAIQLSFFFISLANYFMNGDIVRIYINVCLYVMVSLFLPFHISLNPCFFLYWLKEHSSVIFDFALGFLVCQLPDIGDLVCQLPDKW